MRKRITSDDRMHTGDVVKMFKKVESDYAYDPDVFCPDDARVSALKKAIAGLDPVERTIIILYTELQSYRELGRVLHCSQMTAYNYVERIRRGILAKLNNVA